MGYASHGSRGRRAAVWILAGIAGLCAFEGGAASAQPGAAAPRAPAPAKPPPPPTPTEVFGTVLAIQGDEIVVDLGAGKGATAGAMVELWRPIKIKHPVTGKTIDDRFRIGTLELGQVRPSMSLATASGQLTRAAQVGDVVILQPSATRPSPPAPSPAGEQPPPPPPEGSSEPKGATGGADAEEATINAMVESLRGASLVTRIRRYEDYVRAAPEGRFARVLFEEAAALRKLLANEAKSTGEAAGETKPGVRSFQRPVDAVAGMPLRFAVEMNDTTTGAVLHVRRTGEPAYASWPMSAVGGSYFAAVVPAQRIQAPAIEFFIEGTQKSGAAVSLVGSAEAPDRVEVIEPPRAEPPRKLMGTVELLTDFADYNRFRHNDQVWQTEGSFGVRHGDTGIRAVRLGFGVYRGVGGTVNDLDVLHLHPRAVGLTYGYLETEVGVVSAFSVLGRLAVGLVDDGVGGGGQLLLRIGSDLKTNLLLGGEILGGVGLRSISQLELRTFDRFPMAFRIEVTNQPAGVSKPRSTDAGTSSGAGQVGGRGIVQVGFKVIPELTISVRGSFQGRNIQHAGPGFGGAVGYTW